MSNHFKCNGLRTKPLQISTFLFELTKSHFACQRTFIPIVDLALFFDWVLLLLLFLKQKIKMNQLSVYDLSVETSQTPSKFVSPGPHCSEKRFEKWTFKTQNILLVLYTVRQWVIKRTLPKLTVTNIFHLFVVFILLIWFLYNSLYVIKQYLRFETVVYIEYKDPEWTNIPSITLCTHCIYCR